MKLDLRIEVFEDDSTGESIIRVRDCVDSQRAFHQIRKTSYGWRSDITSMFGVQTPEERIYNHARMLCMEIMREIETEDNK